MLSFRRRLTLKGKRSFAAWADFQTAAAVVSQAKQGLLRNPGIRSLDAQEVSRIRDYAKDRFGSAHYAPWLEFYTLFRGEFLEGWVPADFFQNIAIRELNGLFYKIGASRSLMPRILETEMAPDLAHFVSGEWRDISGARIGRDEARALIFSHDDEVCVKIESTSRGRGVSFARRDNTDMADLERNGDLVVQSLITQHPFFDNVSPSAVATLRVTTGKLSGVAPFLIGSYLRCSLGNGRAVGESSLRISVVDGDGMLSEFGSDPTWGRHTTHPDTGASFGGMRIPSYREMVASCIELHDRVPQLGFIGWDVILDASGNVRLMEVNTGQPDMKYIEMSQGPALRAFNLERFAPGSRYRPPS